MSKNRDFQELSQAYLAFARERLDAIDTRTDVDELRETALCAPHIRVLSQLAAMIPGARSTELVGLASRLAVALDRYRIRRDDGSREHVVTMLAAFERGMASVARP